MTFIIIVVHESVVNNRRCRVGQLLKFKNASARLAVSPEFLRKLQRTGRLKTVHLGRAVRIAEGEIDRLAKEGTGDKR